MPLYRDHFGYVDLPDPDAVVADADSEPATASVTLRLPSGLKSSVDRAAARDGLSSDSWLLLAIAASVRLSKPSAA